MRGWKKVKQEMQENREIEKERKKERKKERYKTREENTYKTQLAVVQEERE